MRAIVCDPTLPQRLGIKHVPDQQNLLDDVIVRVEAISLNQGEIRRAIEEAPAGWIPGWDFAGVVTRAAHGDGGSVDQDVEALCSDHRSSESIGRGRRRTKRA